MILLWRCPKITSFHYSIWANTVKWLIQKHIKKISDEKMKKTVIKAQTPITGILNYE